MRDRGVVPPRSRHGRQLDFLSLTPEWAKLFADTPKLNAWLQRMNARPSLQATTWDSVSEKAGAA